MYCIWRRFSKIFFFHIHDLYYGPLFTTGLVASDGLSYCHINHSEYCEGQEQN